MSRAILMAAVVVATAWGALALLQQRTTQTCISATATGQTLVRPCRRRPSGNGRAAVLLIAAGALAATGIRFRRDLIAVVIGTTAVSVGLAALLAHRWDKPGLGPTAASLDEAFGVLAGVGLGLLVGSFVGALVARREPRIVAGFVAGLVSYGLLMLFDAAHGSGMGFGETLAFDLVFVVPLGFFVAIGATLGGLARSVPGMIHHSE